MIQICTKWVSILKQKSNFTSSLFLSLRNGRWPQVSKIIAVWCCLNKQRIWKKNCGNQGNSFPKQHLRFQRFLRGYINPHMDYIILDILLKVVNYNIHEKFSLWRYSFHGMLLHTPTCIYLTRSSGGGRWSRTWIREIIVLPSSSFAHKVSHYLYSFIHQYRGSSKLGKIQIWICSGGVYPFLFWEEIFLFVSV